MRSEDDEPADGFLVGGGPWATADYYKQKLAKAENTISNQRKTLSKLQEAWAIFARRLERYGATEWILDTLDNPPENAELVVKITGRQNARAVYEWLTREG